MSWAVLVLLQAIYVFVGYRIAREFCRRLAVSLYGSKIGNEEVAFLVIVSALVGIFWPIFLVLWLIYRGSLLFGDRIRHMVEQAK